MLDSKIISKVPSVKSPLRYPGGKSKALKQILPIIPDFNEFREPFVGGGSVFFALKQLYPNKKFWINDLNKDLYLFWKNCKENIDNFVSTIFKIKKEKINGKELYSELIKTDSFSDFEKAVRFFIMNRITFSGLADSGGYSNGAFEKRFTDSSIKRLVTSSKQLQGTIITNKDYSEVINAKGENVFIFLDPPYFSTKNSRLYGKKGDLHSNFNHEKFAEDMKKCSHKWLITYDDSKEIRELFQSEGIYIYSWQLQYGMNNYKKEHAQKGKELFISNYRIPSLESCC